MLLEQCKGFLNTPPLWVNTQFGMQQFRFPEIDLTDLRPKAIPNGMRLGHQMERVFRLLLEHDSTYVVLLSNLPIKGDNRTLGEIDFILREVQSQKSIHVELTYKFYLVVPEISEPIHRLTGPNKRDMFFTK
ncbi:MAG: DUF1853 family protein, partial [Bacteroidota bacterium]